MVLEVPALIVRLIADSLLDEWNSAKEMASQSIDPGMKPSSKHL